MEKEVEDQEDLQVEEEKANKKDEEDDEFEAEKEDQQGHGKLKLGSNKALC